jgi:hypothetical protein
VVRTPTVLPAQGRGYGTCRSPRQQTPTERNRTVYIGIGTLILLILILILIF